ncbi:MAG: ABC transporter ATP-binding protein [Oscillospiraceae bacterium]
MARGDFAGLAKILLLLGGTIAGGALFQWLMTLCTNQVTYRTVKDLRVEVFGKLAEVPLSYIDGHAHGDLISRVTVDIDQVSDGLLQGFSQLFTGIITILGTLMFMLSVNPPITLAVVVLTPLSLFVASFIAKRSHSMFREQSEVRGEMGGFVEEMIGSQKVVKAFGYEQRAEERFDEINSRLYVCGVKAQFYLHDHPCTRFVNGVAWRWGHRRHQRTGGGISVGQLSSFCLRNQHTKPLMKYPACDRARRLLHRRAGCLRCSTSRCSRPTARTRCP